MLSQETLKVRLSETEFRMFSRHCSMKTGSQPIANLNKLILLKLLNFKIDFFWPRWPRDFLKCIDFSVLENDINI